MRAPQLALLALLALLVPIVPALASDWPDAPPNQFTFWGPPGTCLRIISRGGNFDAGIYSWGACPAPPDGGSGMLWNNGLFTQIVPLPVCNDGGLMQWDGGAYSCVPKPPVRASPTTPTRALNTNFQPSAGRVAFVAYSVMVNCTSSAGNGQNSTAQLLAGPNSPPTTVVATVTNSSTSITSTTNGQAVPLSAIVPAGYWVRIATSTTGTPCTVSLVSQHEVSLE